MYEAKQHKAAVSHKFSVTEKKSVQQLRINDNRERSVTREGGGIIAVARSLTITPLASWFN